MYDFHIVEQIDALIKAGIIRPSKREIATNIVRDYWQDRIAVSWTVDDVMERAKMLKKRISKEKARGILNSMFHHHDAGLGITWDTIDANL